MGWKVILPDRYLKPVEQKIHEIAGSLRDSVPAEGGLMGGKAGLALFYSCYARWTRDRSFDDLVIDWIEQAINPSNNHTTGLSFANGLGGIGWLIDFLDSSGLMAMNTDPVLKKLDEHLYRFMKREMHDGHYDYLHGALGIALYLLRDPGNGSYRDHLKDLVDKLAGCAQIESDGTIRWISVLDHENGKRGCNLGLAHGMPSIIIILSLIYRTGISKTRVRSLLLGALKYLEKQKLPDHEYLSVFPSWALEDTDEPGESRLAWCYGDLGIGMAFHSCGKALGDVSIEQEGISILHKASIRRDAAENHVYDAGICHGASGLALIFNALFQQKESAEFRDAALHWLDVCMNMATHKDGIAGYKTKYLPEFGGWRNMPGLLDGAAGIGLVLLSFVSDHKPEWMRALLIG